MCVSPFLRPLSSTYLSIDQLLSTLSDMSLWSFWCVRLFTILVPVCICYSSQYLMCSVNYVSFWWMFISLFHSCLVLSSLPFLKHGMSSFNNLWSQSSDNFQIHPQNLLLCDLKSVANTKLIILWLGLGNRLRAPGSAACAWNQPTVYSSYMSLLVSFIFPSLYYPSLAYNFFI